ncbi:uncharacterized protein LOC125068815 [Vanessa atalanta]|uniref:uncharacterized protein LOC125068815 n=1 Tax=Vanessa atalanta TaxID=42275 RepID=UPI001FCCE88B|nr:uncharacterized protein LOC125068815 [Vanessa atalanta]
MERVLIAIALLTTRVNAENSTLSHDAGASDTCGAIGFGPWSQALEDWVTSAHSDRHGRIMALPSSKGYYVTERIDAPYLSPPPPLHSPHPHMSSNYGHGPPNQGQYSSNQGYMPPNQSPPQGHIPLTSSHASNQGPMPHSKVPKPPGKAPHYAEWANAPPGAGKIVNRPPAKPAPPALDRVDEPPRKHVSETDLFLLSAIEKLVYRADLMEKRLRAVEDGLQHLLAQPTPGADHEPCPAPFARAGAACYSVRRAPRDWKRAAQDCRALRATLVELLAAGQRRALLAHLLSADGQNGSDYWTGGLNPGLLWIWSHSARPLTLDDENGVGGNQTGVSVPGAGRCLALVWDAARRAHVYRGRDCADELRYVCERLPDAPAPSTRDAGPAPAPADPSAPATNSTAAPST